MQLSDCNNAGYMAEFMQAQEGWTDAKLLTVVLDFLDSQDGFDQAALLDRFAEHLNAHRKSRREGEE